MSETAQSNRMAKVRSLLLERLTKIWPEVGLALLATVVCFFRLARQGLWPDEVRYAEIAREMLVRQDLLVPHLNYVIYPEKPPLVYWMTALSFRLLGVNELAARLPSALFALLGVLAVYVFCRVVFDRAHALLACAILITCPLYAVMAQVLTMDMAFASLVSIAFFSTFLALDGSPGYLWLLYGAIALGILTKGLAALALPAATALTFLWWRGSLGEGLRRLAPWWGLPAVALATGWWFVLMESRAPGFARFYFFDEHVRRFFDSTYSHSGPLYYYVPVLFLGMAPWSVVPLLTRPPLRSSDARVFCLIAAAVVFTLFSLARAKLIPYVLPAVPPLAIVFADLLICALNRYRHAHGWEPKFEAPAEQTGRFAGAQYDTSTYLKRMSFLGLLLCGVGGLAMVIVAASATGATSLHRVYLRAISPGLAAVGLILFCGGLVMRALFARGLPEWGVTSTVLCVAAALLAATFVRSELHPLRSFAALSKKIAAMAPKAKIVCYGRYVQDLPFYTRRRVILVGHPTELRFGAERAKDASSYLFSSDTDLVKLWNENHAVVLVIDQPEIERLQPLLGPYRVIAEMRGKLAITRQDHSLTQSVESATSR